MERLGWQRYPAASPLPGVHNGEFQLHCLHTLENVPVKSLPNGGHWFHDLVLGTGKEINWLFGTPSVGVGWFISSSVVEVWQRSHSSI